MVLHEVSSGAARRQRQHQGAEQNQHQHGSDDAPGHVPGWISCLLRCQGHALDGQKQPDGERQRRPNADVALGQKGAGAGGALIGGDVEQVGGIEVGRHANRENANGQHRQ